MHERESSSYVWGETHRRHLSIIGTWNQVDMAGLRDAAVSSNPLSAARNVNCLIV